MVTCSTSMCRSIGYTDTAGTILGHGASPTPLAAARVPTPAPAPTPTSTPAPPCLQRGLRHQRHHHVDVQFRDTRGHHDFSEWLQYCWHDGDERSAQHGQHGPCGIRIDSNTNTIIKSSTNISIATSMDTSGDTNSSTRDALKFFCYFQFVCSSVFIVALPRGGADSSSPRAPTPISMPASTPASTLAPIPAVVDAGSDSSTRSG